MIVRAILRHVLLLLVTLCIANSLQGDDSAQTKENSQQVKDTKDTYNKVSEMINNNFLPENAPATVSTTPSSDPNISTTTEPYRISRKEFNRILQRNLKGLTRLFNIELKQALKQSDKNYAEFQKNASKEISKFL